MKFDHCISSATIYFIFFILDIYRCRKMIDTNAESCPGDKHNKLISIYFGSFLTRDIIDESFIYDFEIQTSLEFVDNFQSGENVNEF